MFAGSAVIKTDTGIKILFRPFFGEDFIKFGGL